MPKVLTVADLRQLIVASQKRWQKLASLNEGLPVDEAKYQGMAIAAGAILQIIDYHGKED